ncbi:type II toxin-antitoxin system Phd/YefM family antitoxin [Candidatus Uhrbacteria bacterium]|nr:type II toxin-antitoxin system Phd/YefM family antitoxin [Candidatus Uhrbacteria bacterium]
MVRFVNIRELKNHISEIIRKAGKGNVIVTLRGKPKVVLHAVTEDDLEDYLLAHSPKFLQSLEDSYEEYTKKGGASLDNLLTQTERELERLQS